MLNLDMPATGAKAVNVPSGISAWLSATLGSHQVRECVQDHSRSAVWRIDAGGRELILKQVKTLDRWNRELYAYRAWAPALAPWAPELLATSDEYHSLLLTALPGIPMKHLKLAQAPAEKVYEQAGSVARRFRDAAVGTFVGDPDPSGKPCGEHWPTALEYMHARVQRALERMAQAGLLDEDCLTVTRWAERNLAVFADEPIVPVNPDYDTGNWLVDEVSAFHGVIDFEYARWGVEYETFMPIWTRDYARLCEGAEDIFLHAYGYSADDKAELRRRTGFIVEALGGVMWSLNKNLDSLKHHCDELRALKRLT